MRGSIIALFIMNEVSYRRIQADLTIMIKPVNIHIPLTIVMLALIAVIISPGDGFSALTGEFDLGFVRREVNDDNTPHISDQVFTQRYSILYDKAGRLVNGRLGSYTVSLGYEWLAMDYGIKTGAGPTQNSAASNGHVIYSGEMTLDPKEIPIRLKIYSQDLSRNRFNVDTSLVPMDSNLGGTSAGSNLSSNTLNSPRFVNISNFGNAEIERGKNIMSGATLVAGVKNGMTNGYNEVLRHFPMLMLDYRDEIIKINSSENPVDTRLTKLAFVSLNKKENWFHYRYITYTDNIDHYYDYNESQFQLGTVDHMLQRRWVDFTNWLRVSVDGQLTKRVNAKSDDNFEEFNMNLFASASRQFWELRTFNTFNRFNELNRDKITYATSLPLYASGTYSPSLRWDFYTKYNENHTGTGERYKAVSGGYNINAYRTSLFTADQGLTVENVDASNGVDALILTGNLATNSTPLFSKQLTLMANYNIRNYRYNSNTSPTDFLEQSVNGKLNYHLSSKLRLSASQVFRHTRGTSQSLEGDVNGSTISSGQNTSVNEYAAFTTSSFQSITELSAAWTPKPRLRIVSSVSEDIFASANFIDSNKTNIKAGIDYSGTNLRFSSDVAYSTNRFTNYGAGAVDGESSTINSSSSISYMFSRSLDARAGVSCFSEKSAIGSYSAFNADQALNYSFYTANGIVRKLFEINQTFTSVERRLNSVDASGSSIPTTQRSNTLLLGAKYYPLRQMIIAGGARYSFIDGYRNSAFNYYGSLNMQFRLLDAGIDYTYGKSKADNRIEKRISASVRKRF